MAAAVRVPDDWTATHSKAFLLLCAAGVDGFRRDELGSIVPLLQRLGVSQGEATLTVGDAFSHYQEHTGTDTVEDALVLHAIELKRRMTAPEMRSMMDVLDAVSQVDENVSEGERLVLTLLRELWEVPDRPS